ncbi:MAG: chaperone modulator CbpM [Ramlibacter sp.]|nr:chaperone modulator CbpM [Ramlibacter sp.]
MKPRDVEITWLDARETVTVPELSRACGLSAAELDELVDYGALAPLGRGGAQRMFSAECVVPLRAAARLRQDFDLDLFAVAILLGYIGRIEALEVEVRSLRARLPRQSRTAHRDEGPEPSREPHGQGLPH